MDMQKVQEFFFQAMLNGWASDDPKTQVPDMPFHKRTSFKDGGFCLIDQYCVSPRSDKSAGTTTIWFEDVPVWFMSYGGRYAPSTIVFLKDTLLEAYQQKLFVGGRGAAVRYHDSLVYTNNVNHNEFGAFDGCEKIFDTSNRNDLGYHEYFGMSLI